jgi:perosamine synthetase
MSWFVYVVTLSEGLDRNVVMRTMAERGIPTRGYFSPMHLQPYIRAMLGTHEGMLPVTESAAKRTIALPFHNRLKKNEVETVIGTLQDLLRTQEAWRKQG